MDPIGDVSLNGIPFRININSYREKDLADFSPRATVAGNSVSQSELLLYQPLYLTDWRHGLGFTWNTDAMGYMTSMGNIDTRQPGIAMMFTAPTEKADSDTGDKLGITMFKGNIYTWGDSGLRKLDTSTWAWSSIYSTAKVNFALATETWLFYCPDGLQLRRNNGTGTDEECGDASADDFNWLAIHEGYVWGGVDDTVNIFYSSDPDLDDMHGTEAADPTLVKVGAGGFETKGAISFGSQLYIFRKDGIWLMGTDKYVRRILDYSNEASDSNFIGRTMFNGYLYFSIRNKVYQWNGSRVVDVTPPRFSDQFPYSEIRTIGPMVTVNNFLYMIANWYNNPSESSIPGIGVSGLVYTSLFCYDGVGWHKLADLAALGGRPQYSSMFCDGTNNRLYFFLDNSTAASSYFGYFQLGEGSLPYASFPTDTNNVLVSSRLDMGFRRVDKFTPSILIEASNIRYDAVDDADNRYLSVYAVIMGKGSESTDVDQLWDALYLGQVTTNGVTEMDMPGVEALKRSRLPKAGAGGGWGRIPGSFRAATERDFLTLPYIGNDTGLDVNVYKYLIVVVIFHTNSSTQTPILEGMTVRFLLRPDVFYGYNFDVVAATDMLEGDNVDARSAGEIIDQLKSMRNSKHPIEFVDIYGVQHYVYISSLMNAGMEVHESDMGEKRNVETICNLNLVEVA